MQHAREDPKEDPTVQDLNIIAGPFSPLPRGPLNPLGTPAPGAVGYPVRRWGPLAPTTARDPLSPTPVLFAPYTPGGHSTLPDPATRAADTRPV